MRDTPGGSAHADVGIGFAEPDGPQMRMRICDVDQRQVAEVVELQQLVLRQRLLRHYPRPVRHAQPGKDR